MNRQFKMLDCFCGMGGVSDGFALEGFDVTGIDIVDAPKMLGYKHRFIQADMAMLKGEDYRGFDVIWGSPPCREFTQLAKFAKERIRLNQKCQWKKPPNLEEGLKLVNCFLQFVKDANPKIWIMENVPLLATHISMKPIIEKTPIGKTMKRSFWGNFPHFLMPTDLSKPSIYYHSWKVKTRSWERAKIPLICSRAFAVACRQKLEDLSL